MIQPPNLPPNLAGHAPLLGQQQAQQRAAVQQAMHQLAMGIFSQLAVAQIIADHTADRAHLSGLAADSMAAARAYFEGIGVIQEEVANDQTQDAE